ncbi:ABC transporter permease subunit [Haladaptatus sp. DYF46]|uniref:ABC transporter permease subunit n=1 Tax=Haladaptatus sp. DYF46 TaxID=2886041 RepID=UPI001E627499|nr:ABC transporter permease subunit [Haladaptatus sp. DYF46]
MSHSGSRLQSIIKKEFQNVVRSRLLWGLVGILTIYGCVQSIEFNRQLAQGTMSGPNRLATTAIAANLRPIIPIVALIIGYNAITGERESGSLRVLLSLPTTRREIVLGAYLSRVGVLALTIPIVILLSVAVIVYQIGSFAIGPLVVIVGLVLLYGLAWTGIAIGISAGVSTRFRAVAGVFGIFAVFHMFWRTVILPVFALLFTGSTRTGGLELIEIANGPTWYVYIQRLNPVKAFDGARVYFPSLMSNGSISLEGHSPDVFGICMLIGYAILPVMIGYYRFNRVDLE